MSASRFSYEDTFNRRKKCRYPEGITVLIKDTLRSRYPDSPINGNLPSEFVNRTNFIRTI